MIKPTISAPILQANVLVIAPLQGMLRCFTSCTYYKRSIHVILNQNTFSCLDNLYYHVRLGRIFYCCIGPFPPPPPSPPTLQRLDDGSANIYHLVLFARLQCISVNLGQLQIANLPWPPRTPLRPPLCLRSPSYEG